MKEDKNYTQEEMAQIKLEVSRNVILTFRDLDSLKEIKKWAETAWENNKVLIDYIERVRMKCLEKGKGELWEEWKKNNKMSWLGFQTLNDLMEKLDK